MFRQWMGDNRIDLELEREEHQMTDKQKEAIEYFKKRIDICMENANICDDNDFDEEATCLRKEQILTETVVNLIQTQQAKIDSLKDFKEIAESKVTDLNPIGLARTNQLLSRQCHKLQEESEKKDKVIDEMAKYIASLDIEEDICVNTGRLGECDSMAFGECENCLKQYFENKVTDTNVGERKVENGN